MASFKKYGGLAFGLMLILGAALFLKSSPKERANTPFESWMEQKDKVHVLATTAMIQDLVARVGGERVASLAIITEDLDPHSYEIVKGDEEKFAFADIVVSNGLQLEHSASMQHRLKNHPKSIRLGDLILEKSPERILWVDGQVDPHIWMDLSLWKEGIDPIKEALIEIDPGHKAEYEHNAEVAKEDLRKKDEEIYKRLQEIPSDKRYLVTSHDAFNYHVKRYFREPGEEDWKKRVKALQGLAPDEQISPLEIKEIVTYVASNQIIVIFSEANLSKDALEKVKEACHKMGKVVVLPEEALHGDTLGGKTYFEMMDHNARVMHKYLSGAS